MKKKTKIMNRKYDYEYQHVSRKTYKKCEKVANSILEKTLRIYHIENYWNLSHHNVINYLIHVVGKPKVVLFYSTENGYSKITDFNYMVNGNNINLRAVKINKVKPLFCERVSGFTVFSDRKPIIFINVECNIWPKILFTIYHELIHCYLAKTNINYLKSAIRIGREKLSNEVFDRYSKDLQNIEAETNSIAAILYVPDYMLHKFILIRDFRQLQAQFQISSTALHNRLYEYFYYKNSWKNEAALSATLAFRNNDKESITYYRKMLFSNGRKIKLIFNPLKKSEFDKKKFFNSFYIKIF